jgi:hypothetical protein
MLPVFTHCSMTSPEHQSDWYRLSLSGFPSRGKSPCCASHTMTRRVPMMRRLTASESRSMERCEVGYKVSTLFRILDARKTHLGTGYEFARSREIAVKCRDAPRQP